MLTKFLIDVFIIASVMGLPVAVWYAWRYGAINFMECVGLHSTSERTGEDSERL